MPDKLPSVEARQLIKVLEAIGFQRIRQSGTHATYRHPDGHWTIVSIHRDKTIPKGTLRKIIRDARSTIEEFIELL